MALFAKKSIELDKLLQERLTPQSFTPPPRTRRTSTRSKKDANNEKWTTIKISTGGSQMEKREQSDRQDRLTVRRQAMDHGGQESQINYLPQSWNRRTENACEKVPHINVETKTTLEIWEELELTFIRPRCVTFDTYLLLDRKQRHGKTVEQFHSALKSLVEHCQLAHLENELLSDTFTANIIDQEIQK